VMRFCHGAILAALRTRPGSGRAPYCAP
jgi:hypothetical protein